MTTQFMLPELKSLQPADNSLEFLLILLLKLNYRITEEDVERIHLFGLSMFHEGCIKGAEIVETILRTHAESRKTISTPPSDSVN